MNFIDHSRVAAAAAAAIRQAAVAREVLGYLCEKRVPAMSGIANLSAAADAGLKFVKAAAIADAAEPFRCGAAAVTAFAQAAAELALFCRATDPIDAGVYYDAAVVAVDKGIDALVSAIAALEQGA